MSVQIAGEFWVVWRVGKKEHREPYALYLDAEHRARTLSRALPGTPIGIETPAVRKCARWENGRQTLAESFVTVTVS